MLSRGTGEVISILCMAALHLDFTIKLLTYFYSICLCLYWFWSIELILDSSQSTSQCSAEILTDYTLMNSLLEFFIEIIIDLEMKYET